MPAAVYKRLSAYEQKNDVFVYANERVDEYIAAARQQRAAAITDEPHVSDVERARHRLVCSGERCQIEHIDVFVNKAHCVWTPFLEPDGVDERRFIATSQNTHSAWLGIYRCVEFDVWHACNAAEECFYVRTSSLVLNTDSSAYLCPVSGRDYEPCMVTEFTPGVEGSGQTDTSGRMLYTPTASSYEYTHVDRRGAGADAESAIEFGVSGEIDAQILVDKLPSSGARLKRIRSAVSDNRIIITDALLIEHPQMLGASAWYSSLRFEDVSNSERRGWQNLYTQARFVIFAFLFSAARFQYERTKWNTVDGKIAQRSKEMTRAALNAGGLSFFTEHTVMKHKYRKTDLTAFYELVPPCVQNERARNRLNRYYALCAVDLWVSVTFRTNQREWPRGYVPTREGFIAALFLMRAGVVHKKQNAEPEEVVAKDPFLRFFLPNPNMIMYINAVSLVEDKITNSIHRMKTAIEEALSDGRCTAAALRLPSIPFKTLIDADETRSVERLFDDALKERI